jgi:hypothetical protein
MGNGDGERWVVTKPGRDQDIRSVMLVLLQPLAFFGQCTVIFSLWFQSSVLTGQGDRSPVRRHGMSRINEILL